jgi:hypothetical protein
MIFEGSEDEKYKKAIVWSPVAIGDEAFADNFGGFMIFCQLPDNLKKEKLRSVNVAFRFERTYNLEPTVDIEAETGFHCFADEKLETFTIVGDPIWAKNENRQICRRNHILHRSELIRWRLLPL